MEQAAPAYLRDTEVAHRYGISRPSVWRWVAEQKNNFPPPVKLGEATTRWRLSDLLAWEQREVA